MRFLRRFFLGVFFVSLFLFLIEPPVARAALTTDFVPPSIAVEVNCESGSGSVVKTLNTTNDFCPSTATRASATITYTDLQTGIQATTQTIPSTTWSCSPATPAPTSSPVVCNTSTAVANTTSSYTINATATDQAGNRTTTAFTFTFRYFISGTVYFDQNNNGTIEVGSDPTFPTSLTVTTTPQSLSSATANGAYTIANVPAGSYTLSINSPSGYKTPIKVFTQPEPIVIGSASSSGNNFLIPGYTINGSIYNDDNKNTVRDASEGLYTASASTVTISGPGQNQVINSNTYSSGRAFPAGTYTITHTTNFPSQDYFYTYLGNQRTITLGTCGSGDPNPNPGPHYLCSNGDFTGVDIGLTNNCPWSQAQGTDRRVENNPSGCGGGGGGPPGGGGGPPGSGGPGGTGIGVPPAQAPRPGSGIPVTACSTFPQFAMTSTSVASPGILHIGNNSLRIPTNQISNPNNWWTGGTTYPELFTPVSSDLIRTSYAYYDSAVKQNNITVTTINDTLCTNGTGTGTTNCVFPSNLAPGVYRINGNLTLGPNTFTAPNKYVFLVNGTLTLTGRIRVDVGANATFSARRDIDISSALGETDITTNCDPNPVTNPNHLGCTLEGFYSADIDVNIGGVGPNACTTGNPDPRINIAGSLVANAGQTGGAIKNERDLCGGNLVCPVYTIVGRPDLIMNTPEIIRTPVYIWKEIAP